MVVTGKVPCGGGGEYVHFVISFLNNSINKEFFRNANAMIPDTTEFPVIKKCTVRIDTTLNYMQIS